MFTAAECVIQWRKSLLQFLWRQQSGVWVQECLITLCKAHHHCHQCHPPQHHCSLCQNEMSSWHPQPLHLNSIQVTAKFLTRHIPIRLFLAFRRVNTTGILQRVLWAPFNKLPSVWSQHFFFRKRKQMSILRRSKASLCGMYWDRFVSVDRNLGVDNNVILRPGIGPCLLPPPIPKMKFPGHKVCSTPVRLAPDDSQ